MFLLGLNEFLRSLKRNIISIIQLVFLFTASLITVSTIYEQTKMFNGVSGFLDETGKMVLAEYRDDLPELLKSVDKMVYSRSALLSNDSKEGIELWSYNPKDTEYKPHMSKGKWCEDVKEKPGLIRACVSEKFPYDVSVGKVFEFDGYKFYITGFFKQDEPIYGINCGINGSGSMSYQDFYNTSNYFWDPLMMAAYSDVGVVDTLLNNGVLVIDYKDDITDEEMKYNDKVLEENLYDVINYRDMIDTKGVYEHSKTLLKIKIVPSYVIIVVLFIFTIISIVVSGMISVMYEKRNYGIFFITGNTWKNTLKISAIHHFIEIAVSLILTFSIWNILKYFGVGLIINVEIYKTNIIVIIVMALFIELLSVIFPYMFLHKHTPIDTIKQE